MARSHIPQEGSSYYPPRARWYSPLFSLGHVCRRRLALDHYRLPGDITIDGIITGFLVPGLAVWLRSPRFWGKAALAGSATLLSVFMIWLGFPAANLAFGVLISLHATGFAYYCNPAFVGEPFDGSWHTAAPCLQLWSSIPAQARIPAACDGTR